MMNIAINGSSGFIGQALVNFFRKSGHDVLLIPRALYLEIDLLESLLKDREVVINLAGESLVGLWTKKRRARIYNSRVDVTSTLVNVLNRGNTNVKRVISASAIGIYNTVSINNEYSSIDSNSFLSRVCIDWEKEISQVKPPVKVCIARVGVVMGNEGGILERLNAGAWTRTGVIFGHGDQNMSIIHVDDLCRAVEYLMENHELAGVFNLVCPEGITNEGFTRYYGSLGKFLMYLRVPVWILEFFLGDFSSVFVANHQVEPKRLVESGFVFKYPHPRAIIDDCYKRKIG